MASPQPTIPHLRIPHSISEALMMRDFTKRQRKIIDLILRLSWGCGKDSAIIPRQRDFELLGIAETHVSKEFSRLVESRVIFIEGNHYSFNKNYDQWQVPRVKPSMPDKLTELVRLNLNGTYQNSKFPKTEPTKRVSENLPKHEGSIYQNSKLSTHGLASPKETVNKYRNSNYAYLDTHSLLQPEEAHKTWEEALGKLRSQVSKANYRTWLESTKGLGYKDGYFVVGVPSSFVAEHLEQNQNSLIQRTLMEVTKQKTEVYFAEIKSE